MTTVSLSITKPSRNGHLVLATILFAWFSIITVLALDGFFLSAPGEPPLAILLSALMSLGVFTLAYTTFPSVKTYVLALDKRLLILLHSWRMLGLGFVMLYAVDQLPMSFAFLAGFGDALAAIGATVLAYTMFRTNRVSRKWIQRWNMFGMLDFIVAVSVGVLTRQGALLYTDSGLHSDLMAQFPFVIIPAFLVQVFTLTHIIIYLQLRNETHSDR